MERANEGLAKAEEKISELIRIEEQLREEKDKLIEDAKDVQKQNSVLDLMDFTVSEKNSLILEEQVVMMIYMM